MPMSVVIICYGGRLGQLVQSLEKVKALDLDMIIPLRGPVIKRPYESIDKLLTRVKSLGDSHSLRRHFTVLMRSVSQFAKVVFGETPPLRTMGLAHEDTPDLGQINRLVIADNGHAFLMDRFSSCHRWY